MIAGVLWGAECVLETTGAILAARKRLWLLASLLGFRAFADILTSQLHGRTYGIASWACLSVQYLLLICLSVQVCRELVRDKGQWWLYAAILATVGVSVAVFAFDGGEMLPEKLLAAEIAGNGFLGILVGLGWIARRARLDQAWRGIALGLAICVVTDGVVTFLWTFWADAPKLYPVGALIALLVWNWAAWKAKRIEKLWEVRIPLPSKKPPTSVIWPQKVKRWVN